MSFSPPSRSVEPPIQTVRTWQEHVQAGQLHEALAAVLETAPSDETAKGLIDDLLSLRGHLRAKAWGRAERLAQSLAPAVATLVPTLESEVKRLRESGEHLERGNAEASLALLDTLELPLFFAEAETQRGTARVYLDSTEENAREAEAAFTRAVEADPRHYRAITNLGNLALEAGRTDEAIAHYEAALRANDAFANAHHNLGVAYRRKGQLHKSVQAIRKAQRVGRQHDRSDAKASMQNLVRGRGGKYVKWVLWGVAAVALYLILQAIGIL